MIFVYVVAELQVVGIFSIPKLHPYPDHEELADFFFAGELVQSLLRPFLPVAVEMDGTRLLVTFLRECKRREQGNNQESPQVFEHEQTIAERTRQVLPVQAAGLHRPG